VTGEPVKVAEKPAPATASLPFNRPVTYSTPGTHPLTQQQAIEGPRLQSSMPGAVSPLQSGHMSPYQSGAYPTYPHTGSMPLHSGTMSPHGSTSVPPHSGPMGIPGTSYGYGR
jgi:hypothetical protein